MEALTKNELQLIQNSLHSKIEHINEMIKITENTGENNLKESYELEKKKALEALRKIKNMFWGEIIYE